MLKKAKVYSKDDHGILQQLIDSDALKTMSTLRKAGFEAYLVGGSVRDLLVGQTPKDFDIGTSAKPEEIKKLFKNCLLIGKRFRLAHLRFGTKILEVSTFRAGDITDSNLIVRDNQWGTPQEDALRRDFTINGLFYDSHSHTVIDYVGGWSDIQKKVLRCVGDPMMRFKQDPVRMLRLIKFQARLGFKVDSKSIKALKLCKEEITKSSPARIWEEIMRMLESSFSAPFFSLLNKKGLLQYLFPSLEAYLKKDKRKKIFQYLEASDEFSSHMKSKSLLDRAVFFSSLLYPILEDVIEDKYLSQKKAPNLGDIAEEVSLLNQEIVNSYFLFPRRMRASIVFILTTQYRLTPIAKKRRLRPYKTLNHPEFILALKFLRIRSIIDVSLKETYAYWKKLYYQAQSKEPPRKFNTHRRPRRAKK